MQLIKIGISLIALILLSGCAGLKLEKQLQQGEVFPKEFKTTIPFDYVNGWIVIEVEIKNKQCNLILDTGAPTTLTLEAAKELNVHLEDSSIKIWDTNGTAENVVYGNLGQIKIGALRFSNIVTTASNLNKMTSVKCTQVDGILGSSLMRKAIWAFDFQNQEITITNNEDKLEFGKDAMETKLLAGFGGLPYIKTEVNGKKTFNMLDLGNVGYNLLKVRHFKKQKDVEIKKYIRYYGKPWGAHGYSDKKSNYDLIIDELKIGEHKTRGVLTSVSADIGNIGLSFLRDYKLILNWPQKKVKLIAAKNRDEAKFLSYGFSTFYKDESLCINSIYEKSSACEHLKFGDKILKINGKNYYPLSEEAYCDVIFSPPKHEDVLKITVLREQKELDFILEKKRLL